MNPYTPGARPVRRKKHVGLSAKEYTQITGTIASVRRSRLPLQDDADAVPDRRPRVDEEPSFIAETSFVRAPLNSRVPSTSNVSFNLGLSARFANQKGKGKQDSLDRVPLDVQEALVLEDLLYVLMGIQGTYLIFHPDYSPEDDDPLKGIKFVSHPSLDPSIRDLVERILPLGTYYTAITSFIELKSHLDFGLVNHALCAAIRDMLKDYQTLLSQLEHAFNSSPSFSLQKLWFYVHPTIHTLSLIYHLVRELNSADDPSAASPSSSRSRSPSSSPPPSDDDPEQAARDEALGLGGAKLKAVMSEYDRGGKGLSSAAEESGIVVKGGEVLAIIYERMVNMSGDSTANVVYGTLLKEAGRPYVKMLKEWVKTGKLVDPYEELLVKESKFIDRGILDMDYTDEYWEKRYTLRDGTSSSGPARGRQAGVPPPRARNGRLPGGACVPPLLESWKHKILLAGKYLNVIRECGIEVGLASTKPSPSLDEDSDDLSMASESFYHFLESAYNYANTTLLHLLLKQQQLIPRLRALKKYFFLSQSSFLTQFLDASASELRKPVRAVSGTKLQSLLELAVNADGGGEDGAGHHEKGGIELKVVMSDSGLYDFLLKIINVDGVSGGGMGAGLDGHHANDGEDAATAAAAGGGAPSSRQKDKQFSGIDALSFDTPIPFPLSLVISRKTILRYQLIFRFLLHLKHVEQHLGSMWVDQMGVAWRSSMRRPLANQTGGIVGYSPATKGSGAGGGGAKPAFGRGKATTPTSGLTTPITPTIPKPFQDNASKEFENWRLRVCLLRAKMMGFVQQILAFVTFEVIEPHWRRLESKLVGSFGTGLVEGGGTSAFGVGVDLGKGGVATVDELLRAHLDFLDTCLKECMLTSSKLLKAYSKLVVTCSTFAMYTPNFSKSAVSAVAAATASNNPSGAADGTSRVPTPMPTVEGEVPNQKESKDKDSATAMAKRWEFLGKFETNFNHWFQVHLDCVQFYASSENVSLLPLVTRLNSIKGTAGQ
ncbi:hypothetical protein BDN72DRAFT_962117 [Pluteus cervinus]|uniref:Uncharacterized protein n=1 Tax=Pluteus cervinus TaxID=181527 RepID=A0ACD3AK06_9AGAR|nr:hypothetical protein BDN72DRAFT_962117 [Pluteus cervinus]